MTKKNKIVIISIVVAVVLILSITLGVVFGIKDEPAPNNNDNSNNDNSNNDNSNNDNSSNDNSNNSNDSNTEATWGEWVITAPTNDRVGTAVRTNDKGETQSVELPILSSDKYTVEEVIAATYENEGKKKYSITKDGVTHTFETVIPSLEGATTVYVNGVKLEDSLKHKKTDTIADTDINALIGNKGFKSYIAYSDIEMNNKIEDVSAYLKDKEESTIYLDMIFTYTLDIGEGVLPEGASKTNDTNKAINLPDPTREGYDFIGWYTSNDFTDNTAIEYGSKYYGVGNTTLFARWEEAILLYIPIHEVSYDDKSPIIGYMVDTDDNKKPQGEVIIPAKHLGKDVIKIELMCFAYNQKITSLKLPKTIKNIGYRALDNCSKLESITVEEGNTAYKVDKNCLIEIANNKLLCATNKTTEIPDYVKIIGNAAMHYSQIKDLVLSDNVTTIEKHAFEQSEIETITISKNVTSIGGYAFNQCLELTSVKFAPEIDIKTISSNTFSYNRKLNNVTIPNSVTTIENSAFNNCTDLTTVTIPDNVTTIGDYAFSNCSNLAEINLPNNLTTIGDSIFSFTKIKSIHFGAKVSEISPEVLRDCKIETITKAPENMNPNIIVEDNCLILDIQGKKTLVNAGINVNVIPEVVQAIAYKAIYKSNMTSIAIPNTVTEIKGGAFDENKKLKGIYLPNTVIIIESNAFRINDGSKIYTNAKEAEKPAGWAEDFCVDGTTNVLWEASNDAVAFETNGNGTCTVNAKTNTNTYKNIFIPSVYNGEKVVAIGDDAFNGCNLLENISMPDSIEIIGANAFKDCNNLVTNIVLPNNTKTIKANAFDGCTNMKLIYIQKGVETIEANAFNNMPNVTIRVEIQEKPATWADNWYGNIVSGRIRWQYLI